MNRADGYRQAARERFVNAISAIDQCSNRELPAEAIQAGAALAQASLSAAELALRLADLEDRLDEIHSRQAGPGRGPGDP